MEQVDAARRRIKAKTLGITITDYDKAIRAAVTKVYPLAKPQIYIFHINKNTALNIKRKWNRAAISQVVLAMGAPPPCS